MKKLVYSLPILIGKIGTGRQTKPIIKTFLSKTSPKVRSILKNRLKMHGFPNRARFDILFLRHFSNLIGTDAAVFTYRNNTQPVVGKIIGIRLLMKAKMRLVGK